LFGGVFPQVLSYNLLYNELTGVRDNAREAEAGAGAVIKGVQMVAPSLFDGSGSYVPMTMPSGLGDNTSGSQGPAVYPQVWSPGGPNGNSFTRLRTPTVFKTVATAAAGNTALWTPALGKKFRIMRWRYTITDNATLAAPGALTVTLFDGAAGATGQADDVFVPALALNNNGQLASSPWIDLGNGYLSAAANNVLNVNLSAALATGTVRVQVAGTEE